MSESKITVSTVPMEQAPAEPETRTFTQAEVDKIVQDRLNRDRKDRADYDDLKAKAAKLAEIEEAAKSDLQKATEKATALETELKAMKKAEAVRTVREKVATEKGVPVSLLSGETEEDCTAQAEEILKFAKPAGYPNVRDAGEAKGAPKGSTRQQFAEWAEKALN